MQHKQLYAKCNTYLFPVPTLYVKEMTKIKLTLLDNGLDYIYVAVRPIFLTHDSSQESWKYSVLHIYSGIELLLKEKLRKEHWSLIFQDTSNASQEKLESSDFISVYHDELVKRLQGIAKITIDDEPIKKLRDLRNRFEHFEVNITLNECKEIVAAALNEIIKFWEKHLKTISTDEQQRKFAMIKSIATGFETYRKQKLKKFNIAINGIIENNSGLIVLCPDCNSRSFAIFKDDQKECKCFVCDRKYRKDDYLSNIRGVENKRRRGETYDTTCLSCKKETRVRYQTSDEETLYYCLNCLNKEDERELMQKQEELKQLELDEEVKNLEKTHTNEEIIEILRAKLI